MYMYCLFPIIIIILHVYTCIYHAQTGALLRDWRRINVALTRAKYKLILIGSCDTLGHAPLLKSLVDILSGNNWIVDIPTSTQFHTR